MIGSLFGTLQEIEPETDSGVHLIVEVAGVGYLVIVSSRHGALLPTLGSPVRLSVHTHVREGAITLYGFSESAERRAFELLLSAHGVGPALALAILSAFSPAALSNAIVEGDVDVLMTVPGIGRKTAQRLIVDLAQRFETNVVQLRVGTASLSTPLDQAAAIARAALAALGYEPGEIRHALDQLAIDQPAEELVRVALQELAHSR